jgi:hypothetical protein
VVEAGCAGAGVDAVFRARRDPTSPGKLERVVHFAVCNAILVEGEILVSRVVDDNKLLLGVDTSYVRLIKE